MPRLVLAAVNPDNTPHGYNLTFAFPMLLFIVSAVILYLLFSRPHRRIPARSVTLPARSKAAPGGEAPHGAHLVASTDGGETDTTPADSGDSADGTETEKDAE